jgi:hypothetical protein
MRARFGRTIICQKCKEANAIKIVWLGKFEYRYYCTRCNVYVQEKDIGIEKRIHELPSNRRGGEK